MIRTKVDLIQTYNLLVRMAMGIQLSLVRQ